MSRRSGWRMSSAARRLAFNISKGLRTSSPASDLVEGLLNNVDRPPVKVANPRGYCFRARLCRISTKSMNVPAWMDW